MKKMFIKVIFLFYIIGEKNLSLIVNLSYGVFTKKENKIEDMICKVTGAKNKLKIAENKIKQMKKPGSILIDEINLYAESLNEYEPDLSLINTIKEMGFYEENRITLSLILSKNNINRAIELLLSDSFEMTFISFEQNLARRNNPPNDGQQTV